MATEKRRRETAREKRIRNGTECGFCGARIDPMDEVEEDFCCDRRLWDWCQFQTYLSDRPG